jgi:Na+-transporting NADH:ubiquinone oxidoreductase subunit B
MTASGDRLLVASLPVALIGAWNLGEQVRDGMVDAAGVWQFALLESAGFSFEQGGAFASLVVGSAVWLPLLAISLAVSRFWAEVFSRGRARGLDTGWLAAAWFFALLLPPTMPLGYAAIALSFGLVFGCHAFGGTGRYIVNPALLGAVFLSISYPELEAATVFPASLPGSDGGAAGPALALASLLGAAFLIWRRAISAPIVIGGLATFVAASALIGTLSWQLAIGTYAFMLAFIATDSTTRPRTSGGRWAFGALFGGLTIVFRTANPEHPEGSLAALLLASLCVPLIDRVAGGALQILRRSRANE